MDIKISSNIIRPILFAILAIVLFDQPVIGQNKSEDLPIYGGELSNGLKYYIQPISNSGGYINMDMLVLAGGAMEPTHKSDLAHYVEHLPESTLKFKTLQETGKPIGEVYPEVEFLNTRTDIYFTHYELRYVATSSESRDIASNYLKEIVSGKMHFPDTIIDSEKAVFYQEYLYRDGFENYGEKTIGNSFTNCVSKAVAPNMFRDHVNGFNRSEIESFYRYWYRPDNAVLIVTGAIEDIEQTEEQIQKFFGSIKKPDGKLSFKRCEPDYLKRPSQFIKFNDTTSSMTKKGGSILRLYFKNQYTNDESRQQLDDKWLNEVIQKSLQYYVTALNQDYDSFYEIGILKEYQFPAFRFILLMQNGLEKKALQHFTGMIKTIVKRGVTEEDLAAIKEELLNAHNGINTESRNYIVNQLKAYHTNGEPFTASKEMEYKNWLANLSPADVNLKLNELLGAMSPDIAIAVGAGNPFLQQTENEVRNLIHQALPLPYPSERTTSSSSLEIGSLSQVGYTYIGQDPVGGERYILDNGVTVILNKTPNSSFKIHGFRKTGADIFTGQDRANAFFSPSLVAISGAGNYTSFQLKEKLLRKNIYYGRYPYVDAKECGIELNGNSGDMEFFLGLTYLFMTKPRKDSIAFEHWKYKAWRDYVDPSFSMSAKDLFALGAQSLNNSDAGYTGSGYYSRVKHATQNNVYEMYTQLFQRASDFTFILSGNFKANIVMPIISKYLGNLPNTAKPLPKSSSEIPKLPPGPKHKEFYVEYMLKDQASLRVYYISPFIRDDWKSSIDLRILKILLNEDLSTLRWGKGRGVYLSLATTRMDFDDGRGIVAFNIPTTPDAVDTIIADVDEIVRNISETPVSNERLQRILKMRILPYLARDRREKEIYNYYKYNLLPTDKKEMRRYVEELTPEQLIQTAERLLTKEYKYEIMGKGY